MRVMSCWLIICLLPLSWVGMTGAGPQSEGLSRSGTFKFPRREWNNEVTSNEGGVGGTGIRCQSPGQFVLAPDGCNRCFCEQNGELSAACSRALCPPGFPSTHTNRNFRFR